MQNTNSLYGKRLIVLTVALGVVVMFVASFVYRLQDPHAKHKESRPDANPAKVAMNSEQGTEIQHLMEVLQEDPDNAEALSGLAAIFLETEAWDKSASFWERYLKIQPEDEEAVYLYAMALLNMDKVNDSVEQLNRLLKLNPENYYGLYYLGMVHIYYLDDKAQGKVLLEKVVALNPDHKELMKQVRTELSRL